MRCPRCQVNRLALAGHQSHACAGCGGQLLETQESERLLREHALTPDQVKAIQDKSDIACPSCGFHMVKLMLDSTEVEACPGCGAIWLDAWERRRVERG